MSAKKNKIVVTGGCGYIGSHTIVELFKTTGFDVISIDNYSTSSSDTLKRIKKASGKEVKNYAVDLRNISAVRAVFSENLDIVGVIHFAAYKTVPESVENPILYYDNNINSLLNILTVCKEFNVTNFIFSSSCSVYGNVKSLPVNEDTSLEKAESPYAYTKVVGEEIIRNVTNVIPIKAIALRYFNPVGADVSGDIGENPITKPNNLVPYITQVAAGILPKLSVFGNDYPTRDGSCVRDYIHVTDIAGAHIKALDYLIAGKNKSNFELFNLGTGEGVTVLEIIKAFEKAANLKLDFEIVGRRPGDVVEIYSDPKKAKEVLGWIPKFNAEEMMSTAWKWQQTLVKERVIQQ